MAMFDRSTIATSKWFSKLGKTYLQMRRAKGSKANDGRVKSAHRGQWVRATILGPAGKSHRRDVCIYSCLPRLTLPFSCPISPTSLGHRYGIIYTSFETILPRLLRGNAQEDQIN